MYREYNPNILLAPYIETYWASDMYIQNLQTMRIFPDGCVDILFNLVEDDNSGINPFIPYIIGAMTTFSDVNYEKKVKMIGIRFRPCAISAFTKIPVYEFTDSKIDTRLFDSFFSDFIPEQLFELKSEIEHIHYIDNFLLSKLNVLYSTDKQIVNIVEHIQRTKGIIPINELLNNVYVCQRQFERQFKHLTGLTPKMFSSIIRYKSTKEYLKCNPNESLFSAALECGYYDHAHLIRDFKRFGGTLPSR